METTTQPKSSLMGKLTLGSLNKKPEAGISGKPLEIAIAFIEEDPDQPRRADNPGFSTDSLNELAASVTERGIKSPISVREHPDKPGQYLINHGHRRYRAAKIAGLTAVPAFIDDKYSQADQVVENLQRNELTAREIADFIGREQAKGIELQKIAKQISKSAAWVSQHVTLLDLPAPIAEAFNSGRTGDVTVVNELVKVFRKFPTEVQSWLSDPTNEITRSSVKSLREFLDGSKKGTDSSSQPSPHSAADHAPTATETASDHSSSGNPSSASTHDTHDAPDLETLPPPVSYLPPSDASDEGKKADDPDKLKKPIIVITHAKRRARLLYTRRPTERGFAWIKYEDDGKETEVTLNKITFADLLEA